MLLNPYPFLPLSRAHVVCSVEAGVPSARGFSWLRVMGWGGAHENSPARQCQEKKNSSPRYRATAFVPIMGIYSHASFECAKFSNCG